MSSQNPKRLLLAQVARVARALGNEHRLELLELLAQAEQPVEELAARTGLGFANVSQHLQQLRKVGLVVGRRAGKTVLYSLREGPVVEAVTGLRELAEHNLDTVRAIVEAHFSQFDGLEAVDRDELISRLGSDSVTLLDVRPGDEFRAGHLPGAMNIALDTLQSRLGELPRDTEIIAYCRGPYCILSFEAVRTLRLHGFRARRLREGLPEWRVSGLPVEYA